MVVVAAMLAVVSGCKDDAKRCAKGADGDAGARQFDGRPRAAPENQANPAGEEYERRPDNPFHLAVNEPLSTFSIDVDTASYTNVRRMLNQGQRPPRDAVRIEEFVNYFTYDYPAPDGEHPIAINAESAICPWNPKHQLVRVGIQGKHVDPSRMPPRNLVFLVDTSGSMASPNRLPLLKKSLALLTKQLNRRDRVTIVEYAGRAGLVLPPTAGDQHAVILAALDKLYAEGSTNGGAGIQMAYDFAQQAFIKGGANRVILGTDGDFNVGLTGSELIRFIEKKRDTGIYLTVLGFGMGNYKDATLEKLAQHGNGTHAYIDSMAEAQHVFVEKIANLVPIANDVKVQVEFNPAHVQGYRLIGYEDRLLKNEDFHDDAKDAGDMGAGHSVTAFYEIIPHGVEFAGPKAIDFKYQKKGQATPQAQSNEVLSVGVRYLPPGEKTSKLVTAAVAQDRRPFEQASRGFRFAASVASFAMLLRESPHRGDTSFTRVHDWARNATGPDEQGHRRESLRLVQTADRLSPRNAAAAKE
ncbi:MAG: VWA domain-containing protein [Planctomycetes bacterium]|nr:VWA domain-containing protein [Planctomycetota bacterium]